MNDWGHIPVMVAEVLKLFSPHSGDILLDATLGLGGHAKAFLEATSPSGRVVGMDQDPAALKEAKKVLADFGERVTYIQGNFAYLKDSAIGGGILNPGDKKPPFTHVLFDLGIGSHQLSDATRGFSFQNDGPLSMRYGATNVLPPANLEWLNVLERRLGKLPDASDIVAYSSADDLADILFTYGEERYSRRIARVVTSLHPRPTTARQLAEAIERSVPSSYERGRIHPATRSFQALRLAVNRELESIRAALPQAVELLAPGGVLAVLSFHSGEDRIVKQFMRALPDTERLTKRPLRATPEEVAHNPRARSALLRAIRKK